MNSTYCDRCEYGEWFTECCSGAGGCDCHGQRVSMGQCLVCNGTGQVDENSNLNANIDKIKGLCFVGSGPSSGLWAGMGSRGYLI